jgi:fluoride ion exporter CrcB/FEX
MEENLLGAVRMIHIGSGFVALVVAPLAMLVRKGGDAHRRWGKLFVYAMAVVVVSAVVLGIATENLLMAMVALFSFHMVASGYRSLYLKKLHEGQKPARADVLIQGTAALVNGGLFLWAVSLMMLGLRFQKVVIFLVFGAVGLIMVFANFNRFYKRSHDKQEWLYGHMTGFLGGYIATVSAFSAVTLDMIQPVWLQWLWPTIIGSPLIAYWVRYYKARFSKGRRAKEIFDLRLK